MSDYENYCEALDNERPYEMNKPVQYTDELFHPFMIVDQLKKYYALADNLIFHLTVYSKGDVVGQTSPDKFIIPIDAEEFTFQRFLEILNRLEEYDEISLSSRVVLDREIELHIPMIDFIGPMEDIKIEQLGRVLPEKYLDELVLFDSGKSVHGYVPRLVDRDEWITFMGELLLLNYRDVKVSDTRWVGHRLKEGFGSLRWTCNSERHFKIPEWIGSFRELEKKLTDLWGNL